MPIPSIERDTDLKIQKTPPFPSCTKRALGRGEGSRFLEKKRLPFCKTKNPAIVAGFHKGFADEQKANKNSV